MTTDKVLALAREAGFNIGHVPSYTYPDSGTTAPEINWINESDDIEPLIKFAALIQQQMEAENAELRRDAERYRWLRQMDRCEPWSDLLMSPITRTEDIDEAIDRARSANE